MWWIIIQATNTQPAATTPARILLIESEPDLRDVLQELFSSEGWRVRMAENGASGIADFTSTLPDCVVCAYRLTDTDGISVVAHLKNLNQRVPVVVVSAYYEDDIEERSYQSGADAFFMKPFEIQQFLKTINKLMST